MSSPQYDTIESWEHTSDATFRVWGQHISDMLKEVITPTADTGQIDWVSVTRPGTTTKAGFEMYRFDDDLQDTAPIFLKVSYGTGGSAAYPAVWLQTGTGTDGAGTLTGQVSTEDYVYQGNPLGPAVSHAAGGDGWLACAFLGKDASTQPLVIGLERSRGDDGAYDGSGVTLAAYWNAPYMQFIPASGGLPTRTRFTTLWTEDSSSGALSTWLRGTEVSFIPVFPYSGKFEHPLSILTVYCKADASALADVPVSMYGSNKNMRTLGNMFNYATGAVNPSSYAVRYE